MTPWWVLKYHQARWWDEVSNMRPRLFGRTTCQRWIGWAPSPEQQCTTSCGWQGSNVHSRSACLPFTSTWSNLVLCTLPFPVYYTQLLLESLKLWHTALSNS